MAVIGKKSKKGTVETTEPGIHDDQAPKMKEEEKKEKTKFAKTYDPELGYIEVPVKKEKKK